MATKIYVPKSQAKEIKWQYGSFFNISFSIDELKSLANEKGYVNMVMSPRKEPDQYKNTHYFTLNTWKPEWSQNDSTDNGVQEEISISDVPF